MQEKERGREKDNLDNPSKLRNSAMALSMTASDSSIFAQACRPRSRRLNVLSKHITANEIAGYTKEAPSVYLPLSMTKICSSCPISVYVIMLNAFLGT
ncbi:hypothetical protein ACS0TY_018254 [Phlomoides rotata]